MLEWILLLCVNWTFALVFIRPVNCPVNCCPPHPHMLGQMNVAVIGEEEMKEMATYEYRRKKLFISNDS